MPHDTVPLEFDRKTEEEMTLRATTLCEELRTRRSVREFSDEEVPREVLRKVVETAAQAPSGANKQPWSFVIVTDPAVKSKIRAAAEEEERRFYEERASEEWLADLEAFGTDWRKEFLEIAPALIVVFAQTKAPDGGQHYYVKESVGLASGFLIAALHHAGLATLTHTPSPMGFLSEILGRPSNERPFLLLPVGYPAADARVPAIERKSLDEVLFEV